MWLGKYSFQNLFEVVLERFIHHLMRLMVAIFDGLISYSPANFGKKRGYWWSILTLGSIFPFPLVNRNEKEELNMSTTPDKINGGAIQYGRHWLHLCTADALSSLISDQCMATTDERYTDGELALDNLNFCVPVKTIIYCTHLSPLSTGYLILDSIFAYS